MIKTKHFIIALALVVSALSAEAQTKYQYMTIDYSPVSKKEIRISVDGKEFIEEKADYAATEPGRYNVNPLLKKISESEEKGWELVSYQCLSEGSTGIPMYHALLRKKK